jgi:NitT/TauT family transport system substrate-binding protein
VIRGLSKGAPVIVLAQLFQINPLQWIYRTDQPPINTLADLKGRTLGITYGGNDEYIMRALLAKGNIRDSEVRFYSVRYDFTPFYQRKADIWPVYRNSQGPILREKLEEAGEGARFFNPADFGVKFVANSVITSADMAASAPETVRAFTRSLLAAWRDAMKPENASLALETLARYDKDTPDALRRVQLDITRDMIQPTPDTDVGTIDIPGWQQTEAIMLKQKLIPNPVQVERVLKPQL